MRDYAEKGELCGIVRRTENCAISHSPHLNVASAFLPYLHILGVENLFSGQFQNFYGNHANFKLILEVYRVTMDYKDYKLNVLLIRYQLH